MSPQPIPMCMVVLASRRGGFWGFRAALLKHGALSTAARAPQVKFLAPQEVVAAQKQGVPVIDIRPVGEWERAHVPGAVNVEFMRLISGAPLRLNP